jgi:hypothetical protein
MYSYPDPYVMTAVFIRGDLQRFSIKTDTVIDTVNLIV